MVSRQDDGNSVWRIGAVSFLNARPLVYGMDASSGIQLAFEVPSRLPGLLNQDRLDVALCPVIDLARCAKHWTLTSDACVGCDGETLTVRVFSRVPPEEITRLHVDGDSHTSVTLAMVLWNEMYGTSLSIVPYQPGHDDACQAVLLIGDKVVSRPMPGFAHQIDLGGAWKSLTGLPFVFAAWVKKCNVDIGSLEALLGQARDRGVAAAAEIAADQGPGLGWPVDLARQYLTEYLHFTLTDRHRRGMQLFFELAGTWGVVPSEAEMARA
ncbi:MAG: menaquinone biosynthetic enzyme MqnA/MqnD family protein [Phycisphaerae bacterium]